MSELGLEGQYNPHYKMGDLGIVPRKEEHLLTNYEKFKLKTTQKELGNIQKLTRKTVATQTIDFTRVKFA